jgi:hypothetical protein
MMLSKERHHHQNGNDKEELPTKPVMQTGRKDPTIRCKNTFMLSLFQLLLLLLLDLMAGKEVAALSMPQTQTTTPNRNAPMASPKWSSSNFDPQENSPSYLHWTNDNDSSSSSSWEMQTKVTTFQRGDQTVELHAQLHFGDKSYYKFWNDPAFNNKFDTILFELLVDDSLLETTPDGSHRRVREPIMASPNDQALAAQYGWQCQASSINYQQHPKWVHADLSRQEFVAMAEQNNNQNNNNNKGNNIPLWKRASPESSSAAAEAVAALMVGPPTLSYSTKFLKRRLFTNLFWPGGSLASALRTILWWTVPSPELSIVLLDWASLLPSGNGSSNPNALSKVALPILTSLMQLDIPQMRRFLFGQVLLSSKVNHMSTNAAWSLLVTKRNDHALQVLERTLEQPHNSKNVALLYGSSHCPDLHQKLTRLGFVPKSSYWRTAWSVQGQRPPQQKSNSVAIGNSSPPTILPALVAFLTFYLIVGALDWVAVLGDVSLALEKADYVDAGLASMLYLGRHVLLYLGMSKFLVDWTNNSNNNGSEDY